METKNTAYMNNHDFITLRVEDDTEMDAYIAFPEEKNSFPALIVLQEAFGVNHHIRTIAERLCNAGYAAIAPELFHRSGNRIEISYTDFAASRPVIQSLTKEGLIADVKATFNWLQQQPAIIHQKIGSLGFCLGGRVSFMANTVLPLVAAASYYGGGLDAMAGDAVHLHAPHLFYWGGQDTHISQEKVDTIIHAVKAAGKEYINTVISYAGHGFNCEERESYHPFAAKEAWAGTMAFFENRLQ